MSRRTRSLWLLLFTSLALVLLAIQPVAADIEVVETVRVTTSGDEPDGNGLYPVVSADGGTVVFQSSATNQLVHRHFFIGDTNGVTDVLAYDVESGAISRVSVDSSGNEANGHSTKPSVSADGGVVVYQSSATNLVVGDSNGAVDVFAYDVTSASTTRISVTSGGLQASAASSAPAVSGDGETVAFTSAAANLATGDTNAVTDVFIHEIPTGLTSRVSINSIGEQANGASSVPSISANGEIIVFESDASNLIPGDTNGTSDIFVHNTTTGLTSRVSINSIGEQANGASSVPSISANGEIIVFESDATNLVAGDTNSATDVFVHNMITGTTVRASVAGDGTEGDGHSSAASISADGTVVVYGSYATDLVVGDTNGARDVFARDLAGGTTTRVSVDGGGTQGNAHSREASIDGTGGIIAFHSYASNLIASDNNGKPDVFVHDSTTETTTRAAIGTSDFKSGNADISVDGNTIVFVSGATNLVPGDENGTSDIFAYDLSTGEVTLISVDSQGYQSNYGSNWPVVSGDGGVIAYQSVATNLVPGDTNDNGNAWNGWSGRDVFMYDMATGTTTRVSVDSSGNQADAESAAPSISADGGTIVYQSNATNLVPDDTNGRTDVFAYDVATGTTTRISVSSSGEQAGDSSYSAEISADGTTVVFRSSASNLVPGDTNEDSDIFAYDMSSGTVTLVSVDSAGNQANGDSMNPSVSADGGVIAFESEATNLAGDLPGGFVRDVASGVTTWFAGNEMYGELYVHPEISADGGTVVFESASADLVENDTNNESDVFAYDVATGEIVMASVATSGALANWYSTEASVSGDGRLVVYHSYATNLVDGDTNSVYDVFLTRLGESEYNPFDDDDGSMFEDHIEWLARSGITKGCGERLFCPKQPVTRGEMAAFLTRALDLPPATQDYFTDDETSIFEDNINRLAESGITKGCGPTAFCPNDTVTRGQMAAFLVRGLGYTDNGGGDLFTDDDTCIFENDIDKLATAGVTKGCNPPDDTHFCPYDRVTREQMAAFLRRALDN